MIALLVALVLAVVGMAGALGFLALFAVATRRDPMTPVAAGSGARVARHLVGMTVSRT